MMSERYFKKFFSLNFNSFMRVINMLKGEYLRLNTRPEKDTVFCWHTSNVWRDTTYFLA